LISPYDPRKVFTFYQRRGMTWYQARLACQEQNGDLATISNIVENNAIVNAFLPFPGDFFWIGLNERASEGNYVWANGDSSTFRNWAPNEPSNPGGDENCVHMYTQSDINIGTWNNLACEPTASNIGHGGTIDGFLCSQVSRLIVVL
jgi:hypothetical protein